MAGEIWIADDIDELPREIAEAFGAAEPETRIYACAALPGEARLMIAMPVEHRCIAPNVDRQ